MDAKEGKPAKGLAERAQDLRERVAAVNELPILSRLSEVTAIALETADLIGEMAERLDGVADGKS